jgi:crotonobetaine/carnitine-CoA ligase
LLRHAGGERTYAEMREAVARTAGMLRSKGVGPGDRVLYMAGNRVEMLDGFLACGWLGAAFVPVNVANRGRQLEHVITNADPRIVVAEAEHLEHLAAIQPELTELEHVWCLDGEPGGTLFGHSIQPVPGPGQAAEPHQARPGDTLAVLYTSGTTGPAKGVQCPHAQFYWWGILTGRYLEITDRDTLYLVLPMFHTNALNAFWQAMLAGATYSFGRRFSASGFWNEIRDTGATVTFLLGAMVHILLKGEERPADRDHQLRSVQSPATSAEAAEAFRRRFGIDRLVDGYGSTETTYVFSNHEGSVVPACMGRPVPEFEARVVDELDEEMADGVAGELLLRPREPWSMFTGYWRNPEATAEAWRNLWFHTGDRVVRDEHGVYRFVDRLKDSIRRRGENISSTEVEDVLQAHPDIVTSAAVAVPSELEDEEVMAFIKLRPGADPDPEAIIRHCEGRLAYFAIPRYLEFVDELPATPSGKIRKVALRERGISKTTWDREAAGITLQR